MTSVLPSLRRTLDLMPSPIEDRPGLLIRDPFRYSDSILIVPPALVPAVALFDGEHTEADLRAVLVSIAGEAQSGEILEQLANALRTAAFLEDDAFAARRAEVEAAFARAERRAPAHVGSAYPEDAAAVTAVLDGYFDGHAAAPAHADVHAIAAPHVSPEGGWRSYAAAYAALAPAPAETTFVVLGTSHYGTPDKFGLTRKRYVTPLGAAEIDADGVDALAAVGESVVLEDYCHAVEHSLEFQVLFLQHRFGPDVRVLPVLCGPFARGLSGGGRPEEDPAVARFFDALGELAATRGRSLRFVLGVDMAHVGRRYGDRLSARADHGPMVQIAERDRERLDSVLAGDASGFWDLVRHDTDRELKWCGTSPIYTFLRAVPQARGTLLRYEQWNIDPQSVVSFGAIAFNNLG